MSSERKTQSDSVGYEMPRNAPDARALVNDYGNDAKIAAGGQSLSLLLRQGLLDPTAIIDISDVAEYHGVTSDGTTVKVGASTTYTELGTHDVAGEERMIGDAIEVIADPQIRNMGTIGGAISHADPALDIVPPLLCLDAEVEIGSVDGTRVVPLDAFVVGYMTTDLESNEILEAISFERSGARSGSAYVKHAAVKGGWAIVGAAAHVTLGSGSETIDAARVALTAVGDTAMRAPSVEDALEGNPSMHDTLSNATPNVIDDIDPIDDLSGSVAYKERIAQSLTERALAKAVNRAGGDLQ